MSKVSSDLFQFICNVKEILFVIPVQFNIMTSEKTVLAGKYSGGPQGLGDPNDKSLRRVEIDVLIPKKMREITQVEKCPEEVKSFSECCKNASIAMVVTCQKQNKILKQCLTRWYEDEEFKARCTEEYLNERSEFRRTGISKKKKDFIAFHREQRRQAAAAAAAAASSAM